MQDRQALTPNTVTIAANEAGTGAQWWIYRILKGEVPLSRTFSTVLEAGDACAQNDKKGGSAEPKEPPWVCHWRLWLSLTDNQVRMHCM